MQPSQLLDYVRQVAQIDSSGFHQYLLDQGELFTPHQLTSPTPDMMRRVAPVPKGCFHNSHRAATIFRGQLRYCEGYYLVRMSDRRDLSLPLQHAWNVDAEGNVVDTTVHRQNIIVDAWFGVIVDDISVTIDPGHVALTPIVGAFQVHQRLQQQS